MTDKPIPTQRTPADIERAIELLRLDIVAVEDHNRDSHRLRSHMDLLLDELRAARHTS